MTRILAIEWDDNEARFTVARTTATNVEFEHAGSVELDADASPKRIGEQLAAATANMNLGRCEALIGVPRARSEVRTLQIPSVPDNELPDLVRFQAMRQFSGLGEDWPLDYVKLNGLSSDEVNVLAASMAPDVSAEIKTVCDHCQAEPLRMLLRPFAAASFVARYGNRDTSQLVVERLGQQADLTVVENGQAVYLRSVRLPEHDTEKVLITELRRTMAAASNQTASHGIDSILLCGSDEQYGDLLAGLADALNLPVTVMNPFTLVKSRSDLLTEMPANPGRFVALLGMTIDEAEQAGHGIDFLNPRRKVEAPSRRRGYIFASAIAAALVIILCSAVWWRLKQYDSQIAALELQSESLDDRVAMATELKGEVAQIDEFVLGDINWLDQLHELSREFPPPEDAIVDQATLSSRINGGGQIVLEGFVRDQSVIQDMESKLRDEFHQVTGSGAHFDDRQDELQWSFKENIIVTAPDLDAITDSQRDESNESESVDPEVTDDQVEDKETNQDEQA